MGSGALRTGLSSQEYLAFERSSLERHEFADGEVFAMSGGTAEHSAVTRDTLLNPRVVIEVLSTTTEAYDRGDKFAGYRTISSFMEYVIASQKEPRVEVFTRQGDGSWTLRILGKHDRLELTSVGCSIEIDRVYDGVFEQAS